MKGLWGCFKVLVVLLLSFSLLLFAGCETGVEGPAVDEPEEHDVPEETQDVEVGPQQGVGNFDETWELPDFVEPHDYIGEEGFHTHMLVSTGNQLVTISPEGDFLRKIIEPGTAYYDFPRLTPDAARFVVNADYHAWEEPWEMMLLGDMENGEVTELDTPGSYYYYPATWIDNSQFIYSAYDEDWLANIYYKNVDTGDSGIFVDLSELPIDQEVVETSTMHPEENLLYFIAYGEGEEHYSLFEYNLNTEELRKVWETDEYYAYSLNVSPRDGKIAITAGTDISEEMGQFETFGLYLADPETGEEEIIYLRENIQVIYPEFSPCGRYIAMCTDTRAVDNTWSIYKYDIDNRQGSILTRYWYDSLVEPFSPSWRDIP